MVVLVVFSCVLSRAMLAGGMIKSKRSFSSSSQPTAPKLAATASNQTPIGNRSCVKHCLWGGNQGQAVVVVVVLVVLVVVLVLGSPVVVVVVVVVVLVFGSAVVQT